MKKRRFATVLIGFLSLWQIGLADAEEVSSKGVDISKAYDLQKFKFGVGLGLETYRGSHVNEAKLFGPTRTVRIIDEQDSNTAVWLETHYTWDGIAAKYLGRTHSAPGFYVGVRLLGENDKVFDAFSAGFLWAFKRTRLDDHQSNAAFESINVGFGPVWHRTRRLANGIKDGEPLPSEFSDIEYKKGDEITFMFMVSTGF